MTTYYVNPKATASSDLNPGTYNLRPLRTLTKANNLSAPGDTIIVYPNTYTEHINAKQSSVSWLAADLGVRGDLSVPVTGSWTSVGSGTYSIPFVGPFGEDPTMIIVDGAPFIFPAASSGAIAFAFDSITQMAYGSHFYNSATQVLYLNIGGGSPAGHSVRASVLTSMFTFEGLSDCVVDGFEITGSIQYGMRVKGGSGHQLLNNHMWANNSGAIRVEAAIPQLFTPVDAGTGGTLAAGTYGYLITAMVGTDETLPSFERTITVALNHKVALTWDTVVGATSYRVYGRTVSGETLLATVSPPGSGFPTYTDTGAATPDGTTHVPNSTVVQATNVLVENNDLWINGSHGIALFSASSCKVRRNMSHHNSFHGIGLFNYSNDNTVEENRCYLNTRLGSRIGNGIQCTNFAPGLPGSSRNIVQRNIVFKNQDSGISIYNGSADCIVRENISYENGDHGIDNLNSPRCHMIGNVVYGCVTAGLNSEGTSQGIRMYNNISMDNGISSPRTSGNYRADATVISDAQLDYNLSYLTTPATGRDSEITWGVSEYKTLATFKVAQPTQMVHGFTANPQFKSISDRDFHLQVISPAIHAGSASAPDFSNDDFDGLPFGTPPNLGVYS